MDGEYQQHWVSREPDDVGLREPDDVGFRETERAIALCEKPLRKLNLEFVSPSEDNLTFLCLSFLFLILIPLILHNTFWSYNILVSFSTIL